VTGLKSPLTPVLSTNHAVCVMKNGGMNVPQDTPIGKATVHLQKQQNQRLKSLFNKEY